MEYCIPIIYRGLDNFIVEADSLEQAKELAKAQFNNGEPPVICGNEWEEILEVKDGEEVPDANEDDREDPNDHGGDAIPPGMDAI